ncbi:cache domain-containing protein [Aliarcobacter cryaerophilus]|uniref:diguanylate cyclase n=1 Tax=Arcobacter sp. AZ-2023 TaxID=3074453 RepID=A0AA96CR41_9BACT|nr:cache domain-containing protein [Arcobacter sp. AZ-2023]WPD09575.1 cache domain-containing protein [Arcobacter sp. DSM 115954]WNL14405.1 cache domain-containing protein [Arcobacter sp. AZ-2023]WNL19712.1 cache domain-containing protein [Arcobacter sp. AZ-2023]WNL21853.1 cache domain-containing protein [Arcobacter sp. AZ-2023]
MKLSNFITKFIFITAFSSIIAAFLISIFFQYQNFKNDLNHYRKEFTEQKKEEVKNEVLMIYGLIKYKEELLKKTVEDRLIDRVNQAYNLAMNIYETNKKTKTENEIKYLIATSINDLKFKDNDSYFFINSNKGQAILFNKELKLDKYLDLLDFKDANNQPIIEIQAKIVKEKKEGFTTNKFVKPNSKDEVQYLKLSYVKLFEPFDWHIGTGEYIDELTKNTQEEILDWLNTLKYKNSSYSFLNTIDGQTLIFEGKRVQPKPHPYPETFKRQVETAKNPNGDFYKYEFKKPNSDEISEKISFIKKFDDYGWLIGCGVYLDEIEKELQRKNEIFKKNITQQIVSMFIIFLFILVAIYFISKYIADFINKNIKNLIYSFSKASLKNEKVDTNQLNFKEFIILANSLNKTLENKNMVEKKLQDYINIVNQNVIISSTNIQGVITEVSEAFCEISGYKKDELIGKSHNIVRHPNTPTSFYKEMWNTLLSKKEWRGEIKNLAKNGDIYWIYAIITPILKNSEIIGFTSIKSNITNKKHIEELSITDDLTKIYNRRFFNIKIEEEINRAKRDKKELCLIILDIDFFKQYNDTYGHQEGDIVIKSVANVLKNRTNRADDFAFRVGGEEFVIITHIEKDKVLNYANSIKDDIENLKIEHRGNKASKYVTISLGVVCKNAIEINSSEELYKEADDNLYEAKRSGRNCVVIK